MLYRVKFTLISPDGNEIRCYTEFTGFRDTALMYDRLLRQCAAIDLEIQAKEPADL